MEPLDPELQSLVAAERGEVEPSAGDRERVARSLATRVGAGFAVGVGLMSSPAAGAAVAGAGTGVLLKLGAGVALLGTALALTVPRWAHPTGPQASAPPAPSAAQARPPSPAPSSIAPPAPTSLDVAPESEATPSAKADSGPRTTALPPLAEEARLLKQAQQALRDGKPGAALSALSEHQRRFPRGQLTLERSAARVQALCALGRSKQAEREATAFLQQHSGSGLAAQVRASCGFAAPSP